MLIIDASPQCTNSYSPVTMLWCHSLVLLLIWPDICWVLSRVDDECRSWTHRSNKRPAQSLVCGRAVREQGVLTGMDLTAFLQPVFKLLKTEPWADRHIQFIKARKLVTRWRLYHMISDRFEEKSLHDRWNAYFRGNQVNNSNNIAKHMKKVLMHNITHYQKMLIWLLTARLESRPQQFDGCCWVI